MGGRSRSCLTGSQGGSCLTGGRSGSCPTGPEPEGCGQVRPGQELVIAGSIGLTGAAKAARDGREFLLRRFSESYVKRMEDQDRRLPSLDEAVLGQAGVTALAAAGEGGVMNCLWDFLEAYGLGCEIELRRIPLAQETVEVCEAFDLNPYRLHSGGCYLLAVNSGYGAVRVFEEAGIKASVIGQAAAGIARRIRNGEIETYLDRPKQDELVKYSCHTGRPGQ